MTGVALIVCDPAPIEVLGREVFALGILRSSTKGCITWHDAQNSTVLARLKVTGMVTADTRAGNKATTKKSAIFVPVRVPALTLGR
jgi:hypothetical protein